MQVRDSVEASFSSSGSGRCGYLYIDRAGMQASVHKDRRVKVRGGLEGGMPPGVLLRHGS